MIFTKSDPENTVWAFTYKIQNAKLFGPFSIDNINFLPSDEDENETIIKLIFETVDRRDENAEAIANSRINELFTAYNLITGKKYVPEFVSQRSFVPEGGGMIGSIKGAVKVVGRGEILERELIDIQKFLKNISSRKDHSIIEKILSWYHRGILSQDTYDKFIYKWISFNSIYNHFRKESNETDRIKGLIRYCISNNKNIPIFTKYSRALSILSNMTIVSSTGKTNYSDELKKSLLKKDYDNSMTYLARCIYGIRCDLFHGEDELSDTTKNLIDEITPVLDEILGQCLLSVLDVHDIKLSRPEVKPASTGEVKWFGYGSPFVTPRAVLPGDSIIIKHHEMEPGDLVKAYFDPATQSSNKWETDASAMKKNNQIGKGEANVHGTVTIEAIIPMNVTPGKHLIYLDSDHLFDRDRIEVRELTVCEGKN